MNNPELIGQKQIIYRKNAKKKTFRSVIIISVLIVPFFVLINSRTGFRKKLMKYVDTPTIASVSSLSPTYLRILNIQTSEYPVCDCVKRVTQKEGEEIKKLNNIAEYLDKKYPELTYSFESVKEDGDSFTVFCDVEDYKNKNIFVTATGEDGEYQYQDNFYKVFLEPKVEEFLEERLKKIDARVKCVTASCEDPYSLCDKNTSAEQYFSLSSKHQVNTVLKIYLLDEVGSTDSDYETMEMSIKTIVEKYGLYNGEEGQSKIYIIKNEDEMKRIEEDHSTCPNGTYIRKTFTLF